MDQKTESAETYYDAAAASYDRLYSPDDLVAENIYPANYFRLQKLIRCFQDPSIVRIIEVGLGEGTPALTLAKAGKQIYGFDVSVNMVNEAKKRFEKARQPADRILRADINDPISYAPLLKDGLFDGLVAMGVMQHMEKDELALSNMASLLKSHGRAFVMFRNKLFSLFTMNRLTHEFINDDLLAGVSQGIKNKVSDYLAGKLRMDLPPLQKAVVTTKTILDNPVFSKFHNPFEVTELFDRCGFYDLKMHWYHYHPAMPSLEADNRDEFRREAIKLEHETGWRGMFLCSAFVVEATKV